jgi:hypothetical protein
MTAGNSAGDSIAETGFALVRHVFAESECAEMAAELEAALRPESNEATALRRASGVIYGARNLLTVWPRAADVWRRGPLIDLLSGVLGCRYGLVRGLFFDKPPEGNWSLPWHQDLTIAVRDHSLPSEHFRARTVKAGIPHVEAPAAILRGMLTLRIHLDPMTSENGPLRVIPGSHIAAEGPSNFPAPVTILSAAGDVLAIRPLVMHSSRAAEAGSELHRRVIHLEFAASDELPDGYQWQHFIR